MKFYLIRTQNSEKYFLGPFVWNAFFYIFSSDSISLLWTNMFILIGKLGTIIFQVSIERYVSILAILFPSQLSIFPLLLHHYSNFIYSFLCHHTYVLLYSVHMITSSIFYRADLVIISYFSLFIMVNISFNYDRYFDVSSIVGWHYL